MPETKSQIDPAVISARKIVRLEQLLKLAKDLRAALSLQDLVCALDQNLVELFPESRWEMLLPDAMTGDFRRVKHADIHSSAIGETLLEHPEIAAFIQTGSSHRHPVERPQPCTQVFPDGGPPALLVPFMVNTQLTGMLIVWPSGHSPAQEQRDDLATAGEMICHTLQNVQTHEQLHQQNITDDLTGLFNARHFHQLMDYEIERAKRYDRDLSLIFIDLDYFKKINDTYGHLVGSALLGEVGRLFQHNMRKINLACRYGGDEFAILLPSTPKSGAMALAGILRDALNKAVFTGGGNHKIRMTASFGVAAFPGDAGSKETLVQMADAAMYEIKKSGRDGIRCV
jgi:diguanylate cyclase (GGDEF)-like protein